MSSLRVQSGRCRDEPPRRLVGRIPPVNGNKPERGDPIRIARPPQHENVIPRPGAQECPALVWPKIPVVNKIVSTAHMVQRVTDGIRQHAQGLGRPNGLAGEGSGAQTHGRGPLRAHHVVVPHEGSIIMRNTTTTMVTIASTMR